MSSRQKFSLWPWGAMSISVPLLAGLATFVAMASDTGFVGSPSDHMFRAATVFFIVLGAGNAYLMSIAIGDLGRGVLALPIGALVGFAAVFAAHSSIAMVLLIGVMAALTCVAALQMGRNLIADAAVMLITLMLMLCLVSEGRNPEINLLVSYPLACMLIVASMPMEDSLEGIFGAMIVGARASLIGAMAGIGTLLFVSPLLLSRWSAGHVVGVVLCGMVANVVCFRFLFDALHRVSHDSEKPKTPKVIATAETVPVEARATVAEEV